MPCVAPTGPERVDGRERIRAARSNSRASPRWALDEHAHRTRRVTILCHTTIYFYSIAMAWFGRLGLQMRVSKKPTVVAKKIVSIWRVVSGQPKSDSLEDLFKKVK